MTQPLPTGAELDAKARRLQRATITVALDDGGSATIRKPRADTMADAGVLLAGLAGAGGDEAAATRYMLTNLRAFAPLVAVSVVALDGEPCTLTEDEALELEFDVFLAIAMGVLDEFGDAAGPEAAKLAERGFPADAGPAGVGAGGSDDPHRA